MKNFILIIVLSFCFLSCEKEPDIIPRVYFTVDKPIANVGDVITFDARESVNVTEYRWDWDWKWWNDWDVETSSNVMTHVFHEEGEYRVRLRGSNCDGWHNYTEETIIIE